MEITKFDGFATEILDYAKNMLTSGQDISPEAFFLVIYQNAFTEAMLIPDLWGKPAKEVKGIIESSWERIKSDIRNAGKHAKLIAVVMLADTYIQTLENATKRIKHGANDTAAFTPSPGQQQALCVNIFLDGSQWMYSYEYTQKGNVLMFSPLYKIQTIDSPIARLRNLWPSNA